MDVLEKLLLKLTVLKQNNPYEYTDGEHGNGAHRGYKSAIEDIEDHITQLIKEVKETK